MYNLEQSNRPIFIPCSYPIFPIDLGLSFEKCKMSYFHQWFDKKYCPTLLSSRGSQCHFIHIYRVARNLAGSNICHFSSDPPKNITANIFPAEIYSRVNILQLKFATQKYRTKKSCLFNYNLPLLFRNKTVYNELLVLHRVAITIVLFENMYFYSTLIAHT